MQNAFHISENWRVQVSYTYHLKAENNEKTEEHRKSERKIKTAN